MLTLILPLSNAANDPWFELDSDGDGFENGVDNCPQYPNTTNSANNTECIHGANWLRPIGLIELGSQRIPNTFDMKISPNGEFLAYLELLNEA